MRTTCLFAAALWLAGIASPQGQRRIRIGPTYSSLSLEDQSGSSYSFPSYGGSVALITGDESETGLTIARYNNLSTDHGIRRLTLYGLDSYYYPVSARGVVAPFALTALGLARVTEIDSLCLLSIICDYLRRQRFGHQPARTRLRTRRARECRRRGGRNPGGALPRGAGESDPSARGRRERIGRAGGCAQRTAAGRHARAGRERVHPHLRAAARPQPVRGRPLPARHQEGGKPGSADRLRSPRGHRRQLRARMSAQRHPPRARLRTGGTARVGARVRRGRFPPGRGLRGRGRPRHGAGGAWRRGCRLLQRPGHVELQRAPPVAAA